MAASGRRPDAGRTASAGRHPEPYTLPAFDGLGCKPLEQQTGSSGCAQIGVHVVHVGAGFKPALAQETRTTRLRSDLIHVGARFKTRPFIITLADEPETRHAIPEIVRGFKTFSARRINERAGKRGVVWQRGYYEHVIRNEKALDRIRNYIANNPARWADDPDNISRAASAETGRV